MRQALVNENADLMARNHRYVMRITGGDAPGQAELGNFIDPESRYPALVTTSRLLSTGVDVRTCRLIVLDRIVGSMTEFKQILGRGTRIHEETGKLYFTLIDFRGAADHFADPEFDGEPAQVYEPEEGGGIAPPDEREAEPDGAPEVPPEPSGGAARKVYVDGVNAEVIAERVEYLDQAGRLVTESLRDFTRKALRKRFASLDDFLKRWHAADRKQAIVEELAAEGLTVALLEELGRDLDPFDLICHVAFDAKPLTRRERAAQVRKRDVFAKYGAKARAVLDALLTKYADDGMLNLDDTLMLRVPPLTELGTTVQLVRAFGGKDRFVAAVHDLLYAARRHRLHGRPHRPPARRSAVRSRLRHRRLSDLRPAPHARALRQAAGRRTDHAGRAARGGEEAASAHAVRHQTCCCTASRSPASCATTTRWPVPTSVGSGAIGSTSCSPIRRSAARRRTASRATFPPTSAPRRPRICFWRSSSAC